MIIGYVIHQNNHKDIGPFMAFDAMGVYWPKNGSMPHVFATEEAALKLIEQLVLPKTIFGDLKVVSISANVEVES